MKSFVCLGAAGAASSNQAGPVKVNMTVQASILLSLSQYYDFLLNLPLFFANLSAPFIELLVPMWRAN